MNEHLGEDVAALAMESPDLSPLRRSALLAHVAGCPDCHRALDESRRVLVALDALPAYEPSLKFDAALRARIEALDDARPGFGAWLLGSLKAPRALIGGAALAAAFVGFLALSTREPSLSPGGPELAETDGLILDGDVDGMEVATQLELLRELEVVENLDVLDDLDAIEALEEGEPG